jgi:hypothetical protein
MRVAATALFVGVNVAAPDGIMPIVSPRSNATELARRHRIRPGLLNHQKPNAAAGSYRSGGWRGDQSGSAVCVGSLAGVVALCRLAAADG